MTFESEGLLIVAIYIWLPPASYVVFLTTLVALCQSGIFLCETIPRHMHICILPDKPFHMVPNSISCIFILQNVKNNEL